MNEVSIIGLDIAKHVFHAHGADTRGHQVFSRRIGRGKLLDFFATQPRCVVALEACGGAHHWARELMHLGHEVRLIPNKTARIVWALLVKNERDSGYLSAHAELVEASAPRRYNKCPARSRLVAR